MAFPANPQDVEIGVWMPDLEQWIDFGADGDGIYDRDPIRVKTGRSNWTARTDSGHATFTAANRDGLWSPDNVDGIYHGLLRRNLETRIGVGRGAPYLGHVRGSNDLASTPNVGGGGGGSPTTPAVVSVTESAETTPTTTHDVTMPTVTQGERVLVSIAATHNSLTHTADFDAFTVLHAVSLHGFHRWLIYEKSIASAADVTAYSGQTLQFSTTSNARSSAQVWRLSGVRPGGVGVSFAVSAPAWDGVGSPPFSANPNSPSLTRPAGWATQVRWISLFTAGNTGSNVTANPAGFTAGADGNPSALATVGGAHLASTSSPVDPGAFTIDDAGGENWDAITIAYQPTEVVGSAGSLDVTGDLEARIGFQLHDDPVDIATTSQWTRLAHRTSGANGWEWELFILGGELHTKFIWRDTSGVTHGYETVGLGSGLPRAMLHDRVALRFTLDVDNGSSESVGRFYYNLVDGGSIDGAWTELGSGVTGEGDTDIQVSGAALKVGGNVNDVSHVPITGKVFGFRLQDGIGGDPVADIDFTAQILGDTSFVGGEGETWTVGPGGRITDMRWRFWGEVASWPIRWGQGGFDMWAPIEASGLFRRLRQGNRRVESPIRRATIRSAQSVIQYWPMEEHGNGTGFGFTNLFGAAIGTAAITTSNGVPNTQSSTRFLASDPLPTPGASVMTVNVDPWTATGQWQVRWLQDIPEGFTGDGLAFMQVWTTDIVWEVEFRDDAGGDLRIVGYRGVSIVYDSGWIAFGAIDTGWRMSLEVRQNGSNLDVALNAQDPDSGAIGGFGDVAAVTGSAGTVTTIRINKDDNVGSWGFGHLTVQSVITSNDEMATQLAAYNTEKAGDRLIRLCREEGIATRIVGDPADTEQMGPQSSGTLMDLLEECANTDLGILFEPRETLAVGYRCRTSIRDQIAQIDLDYDGGHIAAALELDRDDQDFANDVTVVTWNGSTARAVLDDDSPLSVAEPPVGAGRYDDQFTVNGIVSRLQALANSRLALTSVDEPRISRLLVALHVAALVADPDLTEDILGHLIGDRVRVDNVLATALGAGAEINQIVQGVTETFDGFTHALHFLTTPASPWGLVEDPGDPDVEPPPLAHHVAFRTQQDLAYSGSPPHVLTALGYTSSAKITRADLDGILDDWVAGTGGTTHNVTDSTTWGTARAAAVPGDLIRVTQTFDPTGDQLSLRGDLYGISGSNLTASPDGGEEGLPIIATCADGVYIDANNTSSNTALLDLQNCRHVWAVGMNVRDGQFGIRCFNWGGSAGFPAYVAYCQIENTGHAGLNAQGWFQLITSSGGTPPAGTGNTWGYSEHFVFESNTIDGTGVISDQFGEGIYLGRGSTPGWVSYCRNAWVRGNNVTDWTADGIDVKPGCHDIFITDNEFHTGHAESGAPMSILYVGAPIDERPAFWDFDPSIWIEGNRVYDNDLTNTDASSVHIMGYIGLSGIRIANNIFWAHPQTGTHATWRARLEHGANDTEALALFRNDPTWIINNTCWGDDSFENAGYGVPLVGVFPGTIDFDLRNNLVDDASPATGEIDAAASDFIATVPAIGTVGDAEWDGQGNGSAFDLDPDSALVGAGVSVADVPFLIERDISNRPFTSLTDPNPGAYQPYVAP